MYAIRSYYVFGTGPNGPQLIPRSAVLRPIDTRGDLREPRNDIISRTEALNAFDAFYAECRALVPGEQQRTLES